MTTDASSFPLPPGQSTIRLEDGGGPPTLTNAPSAESIRERLQVLGEMADFVIRTRPVVARAGIWLGRVWISIGYVFLVFGVLFIGGMFVATVIFNRPFDVNGQPAGKWESALFLAGFLVVWVGICGTWIWMSKTTTFNRNQVDHQWRLSLGADEWISRSAHVDDCLGRWATAEIENLSIAPNGRVMVRLASGKSAALTGPLPPFDAAWLHGALTEWLGLPEKPAEAAFPFIPGAEPLRKGTRLAHRLVSTDSPWKAVAGVAALNLIWNGLTGIFVFQAFWGEPNIQWRIALIVTPFAIIGLVFLILLTVALGSAAIQLRIRQTIVELSDLPLRTGSRPRAFVLQPGNLPLRRLAVRLTCHEEADYLAGSTTSTATRQVQSITLFEQAEMAVDGARPYQAEFEFEVPADVMHSFAAEHNRIRWSLNVSGEFHAWPGFERPFPIVVHPACPEESPSA
jgi:hypothetical protein